MSFRFTIPIFLLAATAAHAQTFTVNTNLSTPWIHHWEESIGSGHAALTSRSDWRAHLSRCARELGVKRTRFHGLLDDDFTISLQEGHNDYINLDSLVDFHLSIGMEPLFEISFMPSWLAVNKTQTCTFYKGITSPPKDFDKWGKVIHDLAAHLFGRYPNRTFMFEVWNEPNLGGGFWSPGDLSSAIKLSQYLDLYKETANNLKAASQGKYLVGGPATAGCDPHWLSSLIELDRNGTAEVDFLSCHAYGGGGSKNASGDLSGLGVGPLLQYASAKVGGKERLSVVTEWSSSWSFNNGYHDDVASAPFIVAAVDQMEQVDMTSYWTFSDVFEEGSLIPSAFHGGFGLLTIQGTPKPAYRAFQLLHGTGTERYQVTRTKATTESACDVDAGVLVTSLHSHNTTEGGDAMRVFLYNHPKTFMTPGENCTLIVDGLSLGIRSTMRHARIDVDHANPMAAWVQLGSPTYPTSAQLKELESASELVWTTLLTEGRDTLTFTVPPHGMVVVDVV